MFQCFFCTVGIQRIVVCSPVVPCPSTVVSADTPSFSVTVFAIFPHPASKATVRLATSKRLQVKDSAMLEDNLILTTDILDNTLSDYRQILIHISSDDACINVVTQMDDHPEDSVQYKRLSDSLTTVIRTAILPHPEIRAACIVSPDGNSYLYTEKRENTASIIRLFHTQKDLLAHQAQASSAISVHTVTM